MKIAILAEVSALKVIGGAERVLNNHAISLNKMGHDVTLIVRAPEDDYDECVSVCGVNEYRYFVNNNSSVNFVFTTITNSAKIFGKLAKEKIFDIVMIQQSLAGLGPILLKKKYAKKWVYVCFSLAHEEYLTRNSPSNNIISKCLYKMQADIRFRIEQAVMKRCCHMIMLSEFTKIGVIEHHKFCSDKISIIPGAAEIEKFTPIKDKMAERKKINMPTDKFVLFTVRNLVERMGLDKLIKSLTRLENDKLDNIYLIIGGKGPLKNELERLIKSLGFEDKVLLKGFIPEDQLRSYYGCADLVVMPTNMMEGFGLVTVESLACGTPVLGTPVAAIPEILLRIDKDLVSEKNTAESFGDAIKKLIDKAKNSPDKWQDIIDKGVKLTKEVFNWQAHCKSLEKVLKNILNN